MHRRVRRRGRGEPGSRRPGGQLYLSGEGFIILAALSSAAGALLSKNAASNGDSMTITGWQLFIGGAVLCLIGLPRGWVESSGPEAFLLLGYMILLSAVAFVI